MNSILLTPDGSKKARSGLNMSQAKAASGAGINRAYLSQFESGTRILDDKSADKLHSFYVTSGWEEEQVEVIEPQASINIGEIKIQDGFVIPNQTDDEQLKRLLEQYQDNLHEIQQEGDKAAHFGFLGGLNEERTSEMSQRLITLMARNFSIVTQLHGQDVLVPAKISEKKIKTIGHYIQNFLFGGASGAGGAI